MKTITTIIAVLIVSIVQSQTTTATVFPLENGKVLYTGVVKVDSTITKDELYKRAKKWFIDNYKSANDVIQMDDKDAGEIIGKGYFEERFQPAIGAGIDMKIYHIITISIKDGKYKYKITNFTSKGTASGITSEAPLEDHINFDKKNKYTDYYLKIDSKVKGIIASIEKAMKQGGGDDW